MQALMTDLGLKRDCFWKDKVRRPSSIGLRTGPLYFEGYLTIIIFYQFLVLNQEKALYLQPII